MMRIEKMIGGGSLKSLTRESWHKYAFDDVDPQAPSPPSPSRAQRDGGGASEVIA